MTAQNRYPTRAQLSKELAAARQRIAELERTEATPARVRRANALALAPPVRLADGWRVLADALPFPIGAARSRDGVIVYANQALADLLGLPVAEVIGSAASDVYADQEQRRLLLEKVQRDGRASEAELRVRYRDGSIRVCSTTLVPLVLDGEPAILGTGADVSGLKAQETELRQLSSEKAVLLREMNHRVGNSLAVLQGVLAQQLAPASNATGIDAPTKISRFIRGLAVVQHMLNETEWRPLPLGALCRAVIESVVFDLKRNVRVHSSSSTPEVSSQMADRIALVVAELALNSLTHCQHVPVVEISIGSSTAAGRVVLEYRDNGPGYPSGVLLGYPGKGGLALVAELVGYGRAGSVSLSNDSGAATRLTFAECRE